MSAIKGETLVISKTRTRRDGSTHTTHYACGYQRETVEEAKIDAFIFEGLLRSADEEWEAVKVALERAGFTSNAAGLEALFAERLSLWEALDAAILELDEAVVRPLVDIRGRREHFAIRIGRQPPPDPPVVKDCRADKSGLDDGPYLPGQAPRKRAAAKAPEEVARIRAAAWATRRAKHGPRGHR